HRAIDFAGAGPELVQPRFGELLLVREALAFGARAGEPRLARDHRTGEDQRPLARHRFLDLDPRFLDQSRTLDLHADREADLVDLPPLHADRRVESAAHAPGSTISASAAKLSVKWPWSLLP